MTHMFGPLVGGFDPVAEGGANVGQLTSLTEHLQPINFMPRFSAIPVNVTRVERNQRSRAIESSLTLARGAARRDGTTNHEVRR